MIVCENEMKMKGLVLYFYKCIMLTRNEAPASLCHAYGLNINVNQNQINYHDLFYFCILRKKLENTTTITIFYKI